VRRLVHTFAGRIALQLHDESRAFDGSVVLAGDVGREQTDWWAQPTLLVFFLLRFDEFKHTEGASIRTHVTEIESSF